VVHVDYDESGQPVSAETFISGWLLDGGTAHFGRIAGIIMMADGSLLVSEDTNGIIYHHIHRHPVGELAPELPLARSWDRGGRRGHVGGGGDHLLERRAVGV